MLINMERGPISPAWTGGLRAVQVRIGRGQPGRRV